MTTPLLDAVRVLPDLLGKAHQADLTMPYFVAIDGHDIRLSMPTPTPEAPVDLNDWAGLLDSAEVAYGYPYHHASDTDAGHQLRSQGWHACIGTYLGETVVVIGERVQS